MEDKRITIKEIAKIAKVSPSTVSMVINNKPGVAPDTRSRVHRIVDAFNFTPNPVARSLVKSRSNAVAMLVTTIQNVIYPIIVAGVESVLWDMGYTLSIFSTNEDEALEAKEIETIKARGFDGVINAACLLDNQNSERLANSGIPTVWVLRRYPKIRNLDHVIVDDKKATYLAVEHVIRMGHKRIGIIKGPGYTSTGTERYEGAVTALRDYGIALSDDLIQQGDYLRESGYQATKAFLGLKTRERPTAICAANDQMATGAFDALLDAGLKIPEDIALTGANNVEASSFRSMEITTVKGNRREMGRLGAKRLIEKIEKKRGHKKPFQIVLDPELIIRRSCGFNRASGYRIKKAEKRTI
ncbi:MAG: LacI family DNA-binding transcriptional regulator [Deltaproteobacteria bacterium]|nr:LacI family DNA-binding transcriptional regulator [Deltaproteobacteria bacterium]